MNINSNVKYSKIPSSATPTFKPQRLFSLQLPSSIDSQKILKGSLISHKSLTDIEHRINFYSKLCSEKHQPTRQVDIVQEIKSKIAKEKQRLVVSERRKKNVGHKVVIVGIRAQEIPELCVKGSVLNENVEKRIRISN